jgi:CBS domain-containing protein
MYSIRLNNYIGNSKILVKFRATKLFSNIVGKTSTVDFDQNKENETIETELINDNSQLSRPKLRVSNILAGLTKRNITISQKCNLKDAIVHLTQEKIASSLVVNDSGEISGIFTARDIIRYLSNLISNDVGNETVFSSKVEDIMTKKEKLVFCSPNDSVRRCREIMFQLKIRNMPVLDNDKIIGLITMKDLADSSFSLTQIGGKKGPIQHTVFIF